jgi:hypothetical protein
MTAQEIFAEIRMLGGRLEARGDRLHVDVPAGVLGPEHRERLTAFKPELLELLRSRSEHGEMEVSLRRLEAACVSIAVFEDGGMRVIHSTTDAEQARADGGTVYTPQDMHHYVHLSPHERRMLHSFKKRFGRTVEWQGSGKKTRQNEASCEKRASKERQA